jgi:tRNA (cmo5U34)-methyltransferase
MIDVPKLIKNETKDTVFVADAPPVGDFAFTDKVAHVFDDMVSRSVPYYVEMQRMVCELAADFARSGSEIYDIGCSTATTLLALDSVIDKNVRFVGYDNSEPMLEKARAKVAEMNINRSVDLRFGDVHEGLAIQNASVVTMLLTLQFVRPLYRERLVRNLYQGMNDDSCLILIEKLTSEDTLFNRLFINHYYDFKRRNGYSETEISKKREALENVLIPYRLEENMDLLKAAGFRHSECFFRWYNFCGIIAVK